MTAAGGTKDMDVIVIDADTAKLLLTTVQLMNQHHPSFLASLDATPQLLKRTAQVVNGLKSTFTFKLPQPNNTVYLYQVEVLDAPWIGANNKILKACVLDLSNTLGGCESGDECQALALKNGTCSVSN
eukprot:CAMPEP_0176439284 /NCGR_PEP_ID=MMETSP0127-20121128/19846_1 /TAXON_ID=938130 /ORGANISM="Platyophrya macrostoma, Strain WH" /LENGTH=127 /DNA_ID=CAMNT_0017823513 /DNA_START=91 /DNA_END=474 /DNA_ORIENTATION=-